MTTINETIEQSLRAAGLQGYQRQAQPVVEALVQRERTIVSSLLDTAVTEFDAEREDVVRIFEGLGLSMPETVDTTGVPADVQARLDSLEAFARANGYTG